jgi:putative ABC transport system permease protein
MRRLSGLRYIYEARLGAGTSLIQECFAVIGIAVGVALLFASQVSSTSLTHSVAQLNTQLVGRAQLQLKASSYVGVQEGVVAEVRRTPGVTNAVPVLERQVNLLGPRGERAVDLIGVEAKGLKGIGPLLRRFSAQQLASARAVALPAPLAREVGVGSFESARLQVGAKYVETLVGATLAEEDLGGLEHSPLAVTSLNYARRLTEAPGRVTRIFVHYAPGRARAVISALTAIARRWDINLEPSTFESRVFSVAVGPETKSEMLFSAIAALVGFMFALDAMLITVPARRRLIADMRPHGTVPTVTVLLIDAVAIGLAACILGLVLGDLLSIAVFNATPGYLTFAFPVGNGRIVSWEAIALAVGVGMSASILGVLWPIREAREGDQTHTRGAALDRATVRRGLVGVGLVCLAVTTFTLVAATRAAVIGNIALVFALLCFLPVLFDAAVALFARVSAALNDLASDTAVGELQNPQLYVRYLAIAGTAALAVFGTVEFGGVQTNLARGLQASARGIDSSAQLWVVPRGDSSLQTTIAFEPIRKESLAALPGVRQLSVYRGSFLDWGARRLWVLAPAANIEKPIPATQLRAGALSVATERVRGGGWAVLSERLVAEYRLKIGERFLLPSPHPISLRLAGVTSNLGWPPGAIIMNASDYAQGWASTAPSAYQISTTAGTIAAAVRANAQRVLAGTGLLVETSGERERRHYAEAAQGLSRLTQIRLLILIAAILAVVGALGALIWSRRNHFAALKCHGLDEWRLWLSLLYESGVILAAGSIIGAAFGLYAQLLGSHFLSTVTGFPIVFGLEGVTAITSVGVVTVVTLLMLTIPGYLVVRVPPSTVSPAY